MAARTQARARFDLRPLEVVHTGYEGVEAACVLLDEVDINDTAGARDLGLIVHSKQRLRHADEDGEIAARLELVHLNRGLRIDEALEAAFAQRIERDNRNATFAHLLQLVQHARTVDPHILAEEHHAVGVLEIFDFHRADRNSDRLRKSDRRALVAHV